MKANFFAACAAALVAVASLGSGAEAQSVSSTDPAAVKPGTYKVEPGHTQIGFSILHMGFTNYSGFFSGASGSLQLQPTAPSSAKLQVTVPVASILSTVPKLDQELKGADWFDTAKYPNATFTSTQVRPTGKDTAEIDGNLTLHGITKPVTLTAHLVGSGVNPMDKAFTVGFEATGVIKRSDFGVTKYLPLVGDDVRLTIAGAFELQK